MPLCREGHLFPFPLLKDKAQNHEFNFMTICEKTATAIALLIKYHVLNFFKKYVKFHF
jgi:hypothetical protein